MRGARFGTSIHSVERPGAWWAPSFARGRHRGMGMRRKLLAVVLGCGLLPLGYVVAATGTASATTTVTDHFLCKANAGSYGVQNADQDITFNSTAPATVLQGDNLTMTVAVNPIVVPTSSGGVTVNN